MPGMRSSPYLSFPIFRTRGFSYSLLNRNFLEFLAPNNFGNNLNECDHSCFSPTDDKTIVPYAKLFVFFFFLNMALK